MNIPSLTLLCSLLVTHLYTSSQTYQQQGPSGPEIVKETVRMPGPPAPPSIETLKARPAPAVQVFDSCDYNDVYIDIARELNQLRYGQDQVFSICMNRKLMWAAKVQSDFQALLGEPTHSGSRKAKLGSPEERIQASQFNHASGLAPPEELIFFWPNYPTKFAHRHRRNFIRKGFIELLKDPAAKTILTNPAYRFFGAAITRRSDGRGFLSIVLGDSKEEQCHVCNLLKNGRTAARSSTLHSMKRMLVAAQGQPTSTPRVPNPDFTTSLPGSSLNRPKIAKLRTSVSQSTTPLDVMPKMPGPMSKTFVENRIEPIPDVLPTPPEGPGISASFLDSLRSTEVPPSSLAKPPTFGGYVVAGETSPPTAEPPRMDGEYKLPISNPQAMPFSGLYKGSSMFRHMTNAASVPEAGKSEMKEEEEPQQEKAEEMEKAEEALAETPKEEHSLEKAEPVFSEAMQARLMRELLTILYGEPQVKPSRIEEAEIVAMEEEGLHTTSKLLGEVLQGLIASKCPSELTTKRFLKKVVKRVQKESRLTGKTEFVVQEEVPGAGPMLMEVHVIDEGRIDVSLAWLTPPEGQPSLTTSFVIDAENMRLLDGAGQVTSFATLRKGLKPAAKLFKRPASAAARQRSVAGPVEKPPKKPKDSTVALPRKPRTAYVPVSEPFDSAQTLVDAMASKMLPQLAAMGRTLQMRVNWTDATHGQLEMTVADKAGRPRAVWGCDVLLRADRSIRLRREKGKNIQALSLDQAVETFADGALQSVVPSTEPVSKTLLPKEQWVINFAGGDVADLTISRLRSIEPNGMGVYDATQFKYNLPGASQAVGHEDAFRRLAMEHESVSASPVSMPALPQEAMQSKQMRALRSLMDAVEHRSALLAVETPAAVVAEKPQPVVLFGNKPVSQRALPAETPVARFLANYFANEPNRAYVLALKGFGNADIYVDLRGNGVAGAMVQPANPRAPPSIAVYTPSAESGKIVEYRPAPPAEIVLSKGELVPAKEAEKPMAVDAVLAEVAESKAAQGVIITMSQLPPQVLQALATGKRLPQLFFEMLRLLQKQGRPNEVVEIVVEGSVPGAGPVQLGLRLPDAGLAEVTVAWLRPNGQPALSTSFMIDVMRRWLLNSARQPITMAQLSNTLKSAVQFFPAAASRSIGAARLASQGPPTQSCARTRSLAARAFKHFEQGLKALHSVVKRVARSQRGGRPVPPTNPEDNVRQRMLAALMVECGKFAVRMLAWKCGHGPALLVDMSVPKHIGILGIPKDRVRPWRPVVFFLPEALQPPLEAPEMPIGVWEKHADGSMTPLEKVELDEDVDEMLDEAAEKQEELLRLIRAIAKLLANVVQPGPLAKEPFEAVSRELQAFRGPGQRIEVTVEEQVRALGQLRIALQIDELMRYLIFTITRLASEGQAERGVTLCYDKRGRALVNRDRHPLTDEHIRSALARLLQPVPFAITREVEEDADKEDGLGIDSLIPEEAELAIIEHEGGEIFDSPSPAASSPPPSRAEPIDLEQLQDGPHAPLPSQPASLSIAHNQHQRMESKPLADEEDFDLQLESSADLNDWFLMKRESAAAPAVHGEGPDGSSSRGLGEYVADGARRLWSHLPGYQYARSGSASPQAPAPPGPNSHDGLGGCPPDCGCHGASVRPGAGNRPVSWDGGRNVSDRPALGHSPSADAKPADPVVPAKTKMPLESIEGSRPQHMAIEHQPSPPQLVIEHKLDSPVAEAEPEHQPAEDKPGPQAHPVGPVPPLLASSLPTSPIATRPQPSKRRFKQFGGDGCSVYGCGRELEDVPPEDVSDRTNPVTWDDDETEPYVRVRPVHQLPPPLSHGPPAAVSGVSGGESGAGPQPPAIKHARMEPRPQPDHGLALDDEWINSSAEPVGFVAHRFSPSGIALPPATRSDASPAGSSSSSSSSGWDAREFMSAANDFFWNCFSGSLFTGLGNAPPAPAPKSRDGLGGCPDGCRGCGAHRRPSGEPSGVVAIRGDGPALPLERAEGSEQLVTTVMVRRRPHLLAIEHVPGPEAGSDGAVVLAGDELDEGALERIDIARAQMIRLLVAIARLMRAMASVRRPNQLAILNESMGDVAEELERLPPAPVEVVVEGNAEGHGQMQITFRLDELMRYLMFSLSARSLQNARRFILFYDLRRRVLVNRSRQPITLQHLRDAFDGLGHLQPPALVHVADAENREEEEDRDLQNFLPDEADDGAGEPNASVASTSAGAPSSPRRESEGEEICGTLNEDFAPGFGDVLSAAVSTLGDLLWSYLPSASARAESSDDEPAPERPVGIVRLNADGSEGAPLDTMEKARPRVFVKITRRPEWRADFSGAYEILEEDVEEVPVEPVQGQDDDARRRQEFLDLLALYEHVFRNLPRPRQELAPNQLAILHDSMDAVARGMGQLPAAGEHVEVAIEGDAEGLGHLQMAVRLDQLMRYLMFSISTRSLQNRPPRRTTFCYDIRRRAIVDRARRPITLEQLRAILGRLMQPSLPALTYVEDDWDLHNLFPEDDGEVSESDDLGSPLSSSPSPSSTESEDDQFGGYIGEDFAWELGDFVSAFADFIWSCLPRIPLRGRGVEASPAPATQQPPASGSGVGECGGVSDCLPFPPAGEVARIRHDGTLVPLEPLRNPRERPDTTVIVRRRRSLPLSLTHAEPDGTVAVRGHGNALERRDIERAQMLRILVIIAHLLRAMGLNRGMPSPSPRPLAIMNESLGAIAQEMEHLADPAEEIELVVNGNVPDLGRVRITFKLDLLHFLMFAISSRALQEPIARHTPFCYDPRRRAIVNEAGEPASSKYVQEVFRRLSESQPVRQALTYSDDNAKGESSSSGYGCEGVVGGNQVGSPRPHEPVAASPDHPSSNPSPSSEPASIASPVDSVEGEGVTFKRPHEPVDATTDLPASKRLPSSESDNNVPPVDNVPPRSTLSGASKPSPSSDSDNNVPPVGSVPTTRIPSDDLDALLAAWDDFIKGRPSQKPYNGGLGGCGGASWGPECGRRIGGIDEEFDEESEESDDGKAKGLVAQRLEPKPGKTADDLSDFASDAERVKSIEEPEVSAEELYIPVDFVPSDPSVGYRGDSSGREGYRIPCRRSGGGGSARSRIPSRCNDVIIIRQASQNDSPPPVASKPISVAASWTFPLWLIILIIVLVLLASGGATYYYATRKQR